MPADGVIFPDVDAGAWYAHAIHVMTHLGVIKGYPDGNFRPSKPITRAEFTTLVVNFAGLEPINSAIFADVPHSHWAFGYIAAAANRGIVIGVEMDIFWPDINISRAEAVIILNRTFNRAPDRDFIRNNAQLLRFEDTLRHWAYYHIIEAANTHYFRRDEQTGGEIWLEVY